MKNPKHEPPGRWVETKRERLGGGEDGGEKEEEDAKGGRDATVKNAT